MAYPGAKIADGGGGGPPELPSSVAPPKAWHVPESVQPMWSKQATLPRLPVPPLEQTVMMYLRSVKPLCTPAEWERTQKACVDFLTDGTGEALQQRLVKRAAEKANSSWLVDWWNELSYLGYRDPITVWVNYFYQFKADNWSGMHQCTRAAGLVKACLRYRDLVTTGQLPVEMSGKTPQDMSMYKFLFNACRIPYPGKDYYVTYDPAAYHHVAVLCNGRVYKVDTRVGGQELSIANLAAQLERVKAEASRKGAPSFPVPVLTSENRDKWAKSREALKRTAGGAAALDMVESSVLVVCLDLDNPSSRVDIARGLWHGDGKNRWFDKPLEFVVFANGEAGFNGEHGLMDGTPTTSLCDWVLTQLSRKAIKPGNDLSSASLPQPAEFPFTPNAGIESAVRAGQAAFTKLVQSQQMHVLSFNDFGKEQIKKWRVSPDAFAQMSFQLAYTRMTGKRPPTYESCSVRGFLHGRTETIRSCHEPGCTFVDAMLEGKKSAKDKYALLQKAAAHQGFYSRRAASAQGCDRHLLGLKLLRKDGEKCDIFDDPVFGRSSSWVLSTSALATEHFVGWGFGEVVPEGLGIAYMTGANDLRMIVSSLTTLQPGAGEFVKILETTLREMAALCAEATAKPAKL
eukprot:Hpha_TRINITY_DN15773_c2_g4::TRINITY_DN15773_c2_g4_i1::g.38971::m.38971/K00624/E2.3.1.7; carnitine O-acetyltransferase